jgi:hypothetical protein
MQESAQTSQPTTQSIDTSLPQQTQVPNTNLDNFANTTLQNNFFNQFKKNRWLLIGIGIALAMMIIGVLIIFYQKYSSNGTSVSLEETQFAGNQKDNAEKQVLIGKSSIGINQIKLILESDESSKFDSNYTLPTGFKLYVPDNWLSSVSAQEVSFFASVFSIPQGGDKNDLTLSLESGEKGELVQSDLVEFEYSEELIVNNIPVTLSIGQETIGTNSTQIYQLDYLVGTKLMRVIFSHQEELPQSVIDFLKSVTNSQVVSNIDNHWLSVPQVFASENLIVAGFSNPEFMTLTIMSDPLPVRLETSTKQYKNVKADLYKIEALKGQQLNILAKKDTDTGFQGSLLMDVFQEDGSMYNTAGFAGDTGWTSDPSVIKKGFSSTGNYNLQTPYTGYYYFIVYSGCPGPEGSCSADNSSQSQVQGYSMQDPCPGQGEYKSSYVTCLNGQSQWVRLEKCTHQDQIVWRERASDICGTKQISDKGAYLLKIFDEKQVRNIYGVKYEDGSEKVISSYQEGSNNVGSKPFGIVVRYPSPVDVIQDGLIRHYDVSSNFSPSKGLMRKAVRSYKVAQDQKSFLSGVGSVPHPEDNPDNIMQMVKTYRLGTNTVLYLQMDNSYFPAQHHIGLVEIDDNNNYKSVQRLFSF